MLLSQPRLGRTVADPEASPDLMSAAYSWRAQTALSHCAPHCEG